MDNWLAPATGAPSGSWRPGVKHWSGPEDTALIGTWQTTFWIPSAFNAVVLRCYNSGAATVPNFKAAIAPTASITSRLTPSGGNGAWAVAAFSGGGTTTLPAATANGGTANSVVSFVDSDIINTTSLARADGGPGVYAMVRGYWPAGTGCIANSGSNVPLIQDSLYEFRLQVGVDGVGTPGSMNNDVATNLGAAIEVIPYAIAPTFNFLAVGDSLTDGIGDSIVGGWRVGVMTAMRDSGKILAPVNFGRGSQNSINYLANGLAAITRYRPRFATYSPYSPNDSDRQTTAGNARQLRDMSIFCEACRTVGTIPVVSTPLPQNGLNASQEGFRRQVATAIRAQAAMSGVRVLDFDILLTNYGVSTGGFADGGDTADGTHPTRQGYAKMANLATPILGQLV